MHVIESLSNKDYYSTHPCIANVPVLVSFYLNESSAPTNACALCEESFSIRVFCTCTWAYIPFNINHFLKPKYFIYTTSSFLLYLRSCFNSLCELFTSQSDLLGICVAPVCQFEMRL